MRGLWFYMYVVLFLGGVVLCFSVGVGICLAVAIGVLLYILEDGDGGSLM